MDRQTMTGRPLPANLMEDVMANGYPAITGPDARFSVAAGGSDFKNITVPGQTGQNFVLTDILANCDKKARIHVEFTDIGKAFTYKPVDWRTFEKTGYPIMPNFLQLVAGSVVKVTVYNDDVAVTDLTVALIGILV